MSSVNCCAFCLSLNVLKASSPDSVVQPQFKMYTTHWCQAQQGCWVDMEHWIQRDAAGIKPCLLTYWAQNKMAAILQMTFSN